MEKLTNEEFEQIVERIKMSKKEKETEELKRFGHLSMKTYFRS
jgi:hypothetical protein